MSSIWQALSVEFLRLVVISLLVATPIAYNYLHGWLQQYTYRAALSWWIFAVMAAGTLLITLLNGVVILKGFITKRVF